MKHFRLTPYQSSRSDILSVIFLFRKLYMAEKGNTKQEILEAALDLFSAQGFEATFMQLMT